MKRTFLPVLSYGSLAAVILAMTAATVVERLQGTEAAFKWIYHNPLFIAFWAVAAVTGLLYLISRRVHRRMATMGLHVAFVLILAGALLTFLSGDSGEVTLHPGEPVSAYEKEDGTACELPFTLVLDTFTVESYPGSKMPSNFISVVKVNGSETYTISMNHILKKQGYRLYQADYDLEEGTSVLAVSHDSLGVTVTYAGYLLLLVSMIGFFFEKKSGFRAALSRLSAPLAAILLLLVPGMLQARDKAGIGLGDLYVYSHQRVCPLPLRQWDPSVKSMKIFPVRDSLGSVTWYASDDELPQAVMDDFDHWSFIRKSLDLVEESVDKGDRAEASRLIGKIRAYQEKTAEDVLPSRSRFRAEQCYNRIARPRIPFMAALGLGLVLFVLTGIALSRGRNLSKGVQMPAVILIGVLLAYLTTVLGLRWYISGHAPFAGTYCVMMLMAWLSSLAVLLLWKRLPLIVSLGYLVAGFTMLMASRAGTDPGISHLMPVLKSPLLSIHVVSMMLCYTLFALAALNGIMGLAVRRGAPRLMDLSRVILYPAVFLLTFGIFIGAVWANISWGSYWAWDPKETWALITLLIYAACLHGGSLKAFRNPRFFHLYTLLAFLSVLITWFGVNFILGGMHAYA